MLQPSETRDGLTEVYRLIKFRLDGKLSSVLVEGAESVSMFRPGPPSDQ